MAWKVATLARVANGWSMNTDTMGVYGNYYLKRAIVTQLGLGANLPEDAIYPLNLGDETGKPLDGANKYTIHFDKGAAPPVNAFWSITLYDAEGFQVGNVLNRFAVSSWMPFKYNADGSLDLYFQNESPGQGQGSQLAAGAEGTVQPDHAPLRPEVRRADRQVEPATGRESTDRSGGPVGPMRFASTPALRRRRCDLTNANFQKTSEKGANTMLTKRDLLRSAALAALTVTTVTTIPAIAQNKAEWPSILEAKDIAEEGFIYGLPIVMNYAVMHEYAVDKNSGQFKAPFNQINNEARVSTYKDTAVITPNSDTPVLDRYGWICVPNRSFSRCRLWTRIVTFR